MGVQEGKTIMRSALMQITPETQHLKKAIEDYFSYAVVPVIRDYPEQGIDQIGSGTLLDVNGSLCLLSAKHVFSGVPALELSIPTHPRRGPDITALWPFEIFESSDANHDVIMLRLGDELSERLRANWRVTPLQRCREPQRCAPLAVSGYPSGLGRKVGGILGGTLLTTYTELLMDVPSLAAKPIDLLNDLFLLHGETGMKSDGATIATPRLKGVSGAGIWEVELPQSGQMWDVASALHLIGVETDARHYEYIRGISWRLIKSAIIPQI